MLTTLSPSVQAAKESGLFTYPGPYAEYFRSLPDGPKVGSVTLSPRGDWRMPSDAVAKLWLDELETL